MSLANMYTELKRQAARTGEVRRLKLRGGAQLAVRVDSGVVTLTISRPKRQVGAVEIETFKRDCAIPADAIRFPLDEQGTRTDGDGLLWFYIAYRWREP